MHSQLAHPALCTWPTSADGTRAFACPIARAADEKYVYHAVHMIFKGQFEPWEPGEERGSKLVFIGKHLDSAALKAGFAECLETPENMQRRLQALRFKVGDRVQCNMSHGERQAGTVVQLMWRDECVHHSAPIHTYIAAAIRA